MTTRKTAPGRIDWRTDRDTIDLAAVATRLLGPALKRQGHRLYWRCPFHDDHDPSLGVDTVRQSWKCWPCDVGGDAAALLMQFNGWTFPEAKAYLTGGPAPAGASRPRPRPSERPPAVAPPEPSGLPEADALALVEAAAARLWNPEGVDGLKFLTGPRRRLNPETIRAARLGWTPWLTIPKEDGSGFRALGVVIPWFASGRLTLVKIRQPDGRRPKYVQAFHDPARHEGIYPGPETIRPGRPLVIVEGEFDALCLGDALGELAAVVTLGSASARPNLGILGKMLAAAPWFIATDRDTAGDKAAGEWPAPARARRTRPPGPFKDWTEAKSAGVDLSRWWRDILAGIDRPPLFTWDDLSQQRWGESRDDPTPGIVIDRPDPARLRAIMETQATARGPSEDEAESV